MGNGVKFKVGDRILFTMKSGKTYSDHYRANGKCGVISKIDLYEGSDIGPYWVTFGELGESADIHDYELSREVMDSKLARNLYKNQILKIEDGKIWLK